MSNRNGRPNFVFTAALFCVKITLLLLFSKFTAIRRAVSPVGVIISCGLVQDKAWPDGDNGLKRQSPFCKQLQTGQRRHTARRGQGEMVNE